jgi:hypothetical protein
MHLIYKLKELLKSTKYKLLEMSSLFHRLYWISATRLLMAAQLSELAA